MSTAVTEHKPAPSDRDLVAVIADRGAAVGLRLNRLQMFLEKNKANIFQALPRHVTAERMIRVMLTSIRKTPKLLDCTPESLFASLTQAASLGLETDGVLGQAYLIPFGDECTLIPGYKGLLSLCRRSKQISTFDVQSVYKDDAFSYQLGDNPFIRHTPSEAEGERDDSDITHVYAIARLRDGGIQRQVWTRARIEAHKRKFCGRNKTTWQQHWKAMAEKTVLRALCKLLPMSPEAMDLIANDEHQETLNVNFTPAIEREPLSLGELDQHLGGAPAGDDPPEQGDFPPDNWEATAKAEIFDAPNKAGADAVLDHWRGKIPAEEHFKLEAWHAERIESIKASRGPRSNEKQQTLA